MTFRHHVSELDAINGTKSRPKLRPKSGPSWDHVGTKSGPSRDKAIIHAPTQLATQLHKVHFSLNGIKSVIKQVGEHVTEQVPATNHREHRGHRDLASEILNLQNHHKPCDELFTQEMIDTICYPVGSELNTDFNPLLVTLHDMKEGNYDN